MRIFFLKVSLPPAAVRKKRSNHSLSFLTLQAQLSSRYVFLLPAVFEIESAAFVGAQVEAKSHGCPAGAESAALEEALYALLEVNLSSNGPGAAASTLSDCCASLLLTVSG